MTLTLKMQIEHAEKTRREIVDRLKEQDELIAVLEEKRQECKHKFSNPLKGWEHEGGNCELCGINEVQAHTGNIGIFN